MDLVQQILITILLGLVIVLALFFLQTGGFSKALSSNSSPYFKPSFLILGANNAGKSSLFYRFLDDAQEEGKKRPFTPTVSSMEPNISTINLPFANKSVSRTFQIVDYPGHLKYFQLFYTLLLEQITLQKVRGVVYVIDSSSQWFNNNENVEMIAKFLFNLFSVTERLQNGIDFLFAINKNDLFDSIPVHKVKSVLEAEINKLIQNELNTVDKQSGIDKSEEDGASDDHYYSSIGHDTLREFWLSVVGRPDNKFSFDQLEGNMDFVAGSVLKNKVETWENWFDEKVVN
ncbi:signal recognition particle receptor beta subunit-domain-containing protein [Scheffersomyces xylosifermentans]|uniref:signal recognition particle receptor beta subunit-domain-containing protein n=1 Tax=Scheffersomyces xylosifermentans TaxID=1304137 RepID=UPI00315DFC77